MFVLCETLYSWKLKMQCLRRKEKGDYHEKKYLEKSKKQKREKECVYYEKRKKIFTMDDLFRSIGSRILSGLSDKSKCRSQVFHSWDS